MSNNTSTIITELAGLLTQQLPEPRDIAPATDLISDLALESVQIMEFMVDVEDHYDIGVSFVQLQGADRRELSSFLKVMPES